MLLFIPVQLTSRWLVLHRFGVHFKHKDLREDAVEDHEVSEWDVLQVIHIENWVTLTLMLLAVHPQICLKHLLCELCHLLTCKFASSSRVNLCGFFALIRLVRKHLLCIHGMHLIEVLMAKSWHIRVIEVAMVQVKRILALFDSYPLLEVLHEILGA